MKKSFSDLFIEKINTKYCKEASAEDNNDSPQIIDTRITMLITAGAAMAANCELYLRKAVQALIQSGARDTEIRKAVEIGQFVKDKPATILKETADILTGTNLLSNSFSGECPANTARNEEEFKLTMLIAAGAAMAANCEPCMNKIVPDLIEAKVNHVDIQQAVKIGQCVKDEAASFMKEYATELTGTEFLEDPVPCQCQEEQSPAACCG